MKKINFSCKSLFLTILILIRFLAVSADEGMWIPLLLEKYTIEDMQAKGFKLTAEDIYSINQASMKDAVMIFGGGCTAELISDQGLLITNHHCGYSSIQSHSSIEHDYLTDGFWAATRENELPDPNLTVTFLVRMEDVTDSVLSKIKMNISESERQDKIDEITTDIEAKAVEDTHYKASVKSFYGGNEYYLFITETYKDVRLVGAPPSAIGKFGGDTDNWMWPRHTGDFSLFRIYAGKDNKPAGYSPDNVPYKPKKHFRISLKGVKKGDFTMVFGYPGRTREYLTSDAVHLISEIENPRRIAIRKKKIDIIGRYIDEDPLIRIQYASKYASISNYWKKWIGESRGLNRFDAINKKKKLEADFTTRLQANDSLNKLYGNLLPEFKMVYHEITPYTLAADYFFEAAYRLDIIQFARSFKKLAYVEPDIPNEEIKSDIERLKKHCDSFFKNFNLQVDKKVTVACMQLYYENIDTTFFPEIFSLVKKDFNDNFKLYIETAYNNSILTDKLKLSDFLDNFDTTKISVLQEDPVFVLYRSLVSSYVFDIMPEFKRLNSKIDSLDRLYIKALRDIYPEKRFYPDANSTLRIAFGQIDDYVPMDAVEYDFYTTLEGIIEKDNPDIYDYRVPAKLKELYNEKNYGQYSEDGKMHVCFIASNHTTGGNSGSPVINADGDLIGVNFDRNWEGTMSDIMYNPAQCRNIAIDIRYALFIIDKFAGATHLIEEMSLVNKNIKETSKKKGLFHH